MRHVETEASIDTEQSSRHPSIQARRSGRVAGVVAVIGVALVVAFGIAPGPSDAIVPTRSRLDHETFVRRADRICRATVQRTDAIVEDLGFSPSDAEARRAVRRIAGASRREVRELRALRAPRGDATELAQIYDAVTLAFDRIAEKPHRLFDEPGPRVRAAKLAEAYGFRVCGRG